MIKEVIITNLAGETLPLTLDHPEKSGFIVKSISGLGPVKATINTTEYSTIDGGIFNSARLPYRNIVMELQFLPKSTIEETRLLSYKYFMIKQQLTMEFITDSHDVTISGYVESNTPNIFSKDEGCQISIICPDPYFYDKNSLSYSLSSIKPAFEFPVSWEMVDGVQELKDISYISLESVGNVNYKGTNGTGIIFYIHVLNDIEGGISIQNIYTGEYMRLSSEQLTKLIGSGFKRGDSIYISTIRGNKYVQLMRGGTVTNILNAYDKNGTWLQLRKGDNYFKIYWSGEPGDLQIFILGNTIYEGI